jgi:hypothetical protein
MSILVQGIMRLAYVWRFGHDIYFTSTDGAIIQYSSANRVFAALLVLSGMGLVRGAQRDPVAFQQLLSNHIIA